MHSLVQKWPGADNDVVFDTIVHFVSVLNVNTRTSDVPKDIVAYSREMSPVHNDPSLMRLLDNIIRKLAIWAGAELVKMKAVLPLMEKGFGIRKPLFRVESVELESTYVSYNVIGM